MRNVCGVNLSDISCKVGMKFDHKLASHVASLTVGDVQRERRAMGDDDHDDTSLDEIRHVNVRYNTQPQQTPADTSWHKNVSLTRKLKL